MGAVASLTLVIAAVSGIGPPEIHAETIVCQIQASI